MAQAVITLGCMCVEGGLRARCLEGFCSSPLVGSIIHLLQPSDWRLYFISPALKKMKAVQPRSMSYMQDIVTAFLYSPFYACVCVRLGLKQALFSDPNQQVCSLDNSICRLPRFAY